MGRSSGSAGRRLENVARRAYCSPVADLPRGTDTFVFTDIEGSTVLVKRLRDGYGDVVEQHQLLVRASFAAQCGTRLIRRATRFFFAFANEQ